MKYLSLYRNSPVKKEKLLVTLTYCHLILGIKKKNTQPDITSPDKQSNHYLYEVISPDSQT